MTDPTIVSRHGVPMRQLTDPEHLKALAHPRRLEILDLLITGGPLTATQCAERLGDSPASCSYHLRQLARFGMVEEAEGGTGRQRPWRWVPVGNHVEFGGSAAQVQAANEFLTVLDARMIARITDWRARATGDAWREIAGSSDWSVALTEAEADALGDAFSELLAPYLARLLTGERPAGSRTVDVFASLLPRRAAEESGDA